MKLSIILRFCLWFMGISMAFPSLSQTMLVTNGNTSSRIILKENNQISWTAANLLQTFIQKVTSCKLPVVISQTPRKGDILIGGQSPAEVTEDGFSISTQDGILKISGKENGVVYGVVTLLEQYLCIEVSDRQLAQLLEHIMPHRVHHAAADDDHKARQRIRKCCGYRVHHNHQNAVAAHLFKIDFAAAELHRIHRKTRNVRSRQ